MQIPPTIKILGLDFEVTRDQHVSEASQTYGTTIHSRQKINIQADLSQQHAEQTFIHEVLHAIWEQMGLKNMPEMDQKKEEQIVHTLANGLYTTLKDNNLLA